MHLIWTQLPLKPTDPTAAAHQPSSSSLIRSSNNLVVVNNKAYVFGGEGKPREPVDDELWEIDLKDGSTHAIPSNLKPSARVGSALTTSAGTSSTTNSTTSSTSTPTSIYLYGGRESKEMSPCDSDLWTIDPKGREGWKRLMTSQSQGGREGGEVGDGEREAEGEGEGEGCGVERKSYHALVMLGREVYLHAGCPAVGRSNKLDSLQLPRHHDDDDDDDQHSSTKALKWTSRPDAPGLGRGGTVLCPLTLQIPASSANDEPKDERILIRYGGFAGHEIGSTLDVFQPDQDRWVELGLPNREGEAGHPQARSVHGLVPIVPALDIPSKTGEAGGEQQRPGKVVALMLFGERGPAPAHLGHSGAGQFHRDVWAVVCRPDLVEGTNRWGLGFERLSQYGQGEGGAGATAAAAASAVEEEGQWEKEVDKEGIPEARGWFAVAGWEAGKVVIHGGLNDQNQRLGDCWIGQVVV